MGHDISQTNFYERERWMSYNSAKENVLEGDISHLVCKFATLEVSISKQHLFLASLNS